MIDLPALTTPAERPCKICGAAAPLYGAIDFNRVCADFDPYPLPPANVLIPYNRCGACGFVFTASFDAWTQDDFAAHIYNDLYPLIDPDYAERRPAANLTWMRQDFATMKGMRFLDFGGGNGHLAQLMRDEGFAAVETYDPFVPKFATLPQGGFDVISCFETLEHLPDLIATVTTLMSLAGPKGIVFFSTLLQPANFSECGLYWPYIAPRNGHISIYTPNALAQLFGRFGYTIEHLNEDKHIALPPGVVRNGP